jgi:putative transcriptional regulator
MDKSILETIHESMQDMHDAGALDKQTMREFDALCLPKVEEYTPAQIKRIRTLNGVSQAVFAAYLNTGVETVRKWEARGQTRKRPNGAAMKLISLVENYGIEILGEPEKLSAKQAVPAIPPRVAARKSGKSKSTSGARATA